MPAPLRWVETADALEDVVAAVAGEAAYAVDTEFHRERTYFPQVALVQLAWGSEVVLVDPLAVSLRPLARVLTGPGVAVIHAAAQDLEVLEQEAGVTPSRLFDTQLAAGFAGYGLPSLVSLVERVLGVRLPKGDRLADWLHRPLDADQKEYAAADVRHLLAVHANLTEVLEHSGRLAWAEAECEELRLKGSAKRDPREAWWRIKEARQLRGRATGVMQSLAAWREQRAAATNQPARFVLPDLAMVAIAQRPPRSVDELRAVRGLDDRHLRRPAIGEILAAVEAGLELAPAEIRLPPAGDVDRDLRPAVTLVSAWVSQLGRDLGIDTALLATRADLEALLRGEPGARLAIGWRAAAIGDAVRQLVGGEAALAFNGRGELVLEERSRKRLGPDVSGRGRRS